MKDEDIVLKNTAEKEYAINSGFESWADLLRYLRRQYNTSWDWFKSVVEHSKQAIKEYETKNNLKINYYE